MSDDDLELPLGETDALMIAVVTVEEFAMVSEWDTVPREVHVGALLLADAILRRVKPHLGHDPRSRDLRATLTAMEGRAARIRQASTCRGCCKSLKEAMGSWTRN